MTSNDHRQLANAVLASVMSAGRLQMRYLGSDIAVVAKPDDSPVTAADHESESVLLAGLQAAAPNIPVIAEERAAAGLNPAIEQRFFAVDPLDGTKEFIAGRPEFTINIGLIERGRPQFGLIYAPALATLFVTDGERAAVSCALSPSADVTSLSACNLKPLRTRMPRPGELFALTSRSRAGDAATQFMSDLGVSDSRVTGSSLKFCLIANGKADVYARLGPTNEWDTAAGHAILTAAGGAVTRLDGSPLDYGKVHTRFLNPDFIAWGRAPAAS
jgi:3'(2'), 5'-bisphosphate nucleotidase